MCELPGVHHERIERALVRRRTANADDTVCAFSRATRIFRKKRCDFRGAGRCVAIDFWHKATRLDTTSGKKKPNCKATPVTTQVFYHEYWRHVQYDTDQHRLQRTSSTKLITNNTWKVVGYHSQGICSNSANASALRSPTSRNARALSCARHCAVGTISVPSGITSMTRAAWRLA